MFQVDAFKANAKNKLKKYFKKIYLVKLTVLLYTIGFFYIRCFIIKRTILSQK
jgi:hypothetical protein